MQITIPASSSYELYDFNRIGQIGNLQAVDTSSITLNFYDDNKLILESRLDYLIKLLLQRECDTDATINLPVIYAKGRPRLKIINSKTSPQTITFYQNNTLKGTFPVIQTIGLSDNEIKKYNDVEKIYLISGQMSISSKYINDVLYANDIITLQNDNIEIRTHSSSTFILYQENITPLTFRTGIYNKNKILTEKMQTNAIRTNLEQV